MNAEEFFRNVLQIDPKIRHAGIFSKGDLYSQNRDGLLPLLTDEESEKSLRNYLIQMKSNRLLKNKLGDPSFSIIKYEKMVRITFPCNDEGIILVTADPEINAEKISKQIFQLRNNLDLCS